MASELAVAGLLAFIGVATALNVTDISQLPAAKASGKITFNDIRVPAGVTVDMSNLKPGTIVEFAGNMSFGYKEWVGPLIKVTGKNITIKGLKGHVIDCQGDRWWDGKGGNGGKKKPKFFAMKLEDSNVDNLSVKNTPVHGFSVNGCKNTVISNINMDNQLGDTKGGHNTDGFDVGNCVNVKITKCQVFNQDDCLAVNSAKNLEFSNNFCSGGNGISIGSVGGRSNNVVENVLIKQCNILNSNNGVRIKTIKGATGSVSNVTYEDITMVGIRKRGIVIQGNYLNARPEGDPTPGVPITGLTLKNIVGTVEPKGANIYVWVANASDWTCESILVFGGNKKMENKGKPSSCRM